MHQDETLGIPGLGEPEEDRLWRPLEPAPGTLSPGEPFEGPGAAQWVEKTRLTALPGQQWKVTSGSVGGTGSQLATGTMPTGLIRFWAKEEAAPVPIVPKLASLVLTPASVEAGGVVNGRVTLTSPTLVPMSVLIESSSLAAPGPGVVTILAGTISKDFPIQTAPSFDTNIAVTITASAGGTLRQAILGVKPKPLPVVPELVRFVGPAAAKLGDSIQLEVSFSAPIGPGGAILWFDLFNAAFPSNVPVGATTFQQRFTVPVGEPEGSYKLSAMMRDKTLTHLISIIKDAPPPLPPPGPLPPLTRTIDCTGKTQQQIQAAIDAAQPGDGIYLGAGLYSLTGPSRSGDGQRLDILNRDGIHLFGSGPSTVIDFAGFEGIWLRQGGRIGQGNVIRDMTLRNVRRGICALDPQRLWVQRVDIVGAAYGYATERTSAYDGAMFEWGVTLEDFSVRSWASHAIKFLGGETIRRFQFIDTPGNQGSTYSHGFYVSGAKNVTLTDGLIENTSGHAGQVYSDNSAHQSNGAMDILMERITCRNCMMGPVFAANGHYERITINSMSILGTISRQTPTLLISATNDFIDQLTMNNLILDGGGDAMGLQSGQTGGIRGMRINGMIVRNHSVGIRIGSSATGWPYTRIAESLITGYQAPGVPRPVVGSSPGLTIA